MAQEWALQSAVVLVVESNARKRAAKAADLRQEGFEVLEAADAAGAKAILDAVAVDVVFSDLDLIDGPELAQWVEQRQPATQFAWILDAEGDQLALLQ